MRFLITLLVISIMSHAWAQTGPGGVGNSTSNVLWLRSDNGVYSDAGVTLATNTNNVAQWNDVSGNNRNASQATASERPNYQTGVLNGSPIIRFAAANGDRLLSSGVSSGNSASVWVVASYSSLPSSNPGIIQASSAGQAFSSNANEKNIGIWIANGGGNQIWGRGVQSNGTARDIPQNTNTTNNTFYIFHNLYDGANITQYVNNAVSGTISYNGTLASWSEFGIGRQATESWNGDIAEVIAYNISLNTAQRIIIASYLAAKYGLATTSDAYAMDNAGNGNFDHDVAGIGRVNAANLHDDSRGSGIVRVLNPAAMGNNEFFMWGHNNGALAATNTTDIPTNVSARFVRQWRVSETGDVGSVDVEIDITGLSEFSSLSSCDAAQALRLLVDTDADGNYTDETAIFGAVHMGGSLYRFNGVSAVGNADYFTFGIYNMPANDGPGGVGGTAMWWRADAGVTATAGLINTWADQSGNGRNLSATGSFRPTLTTSSAMNGQPVVRYGGGQYFTSTFSGPSVDNVTLFLAANGSSYQSLFRFQDDGGIYMVYPWENGGGRTFISSSDGGTASGINSGLASNVNNVGGARYRRNVTTSGMQTFLNGGTNAQRTSVNSVLPTQPFFSGRYNPGASEYPVCDVGEMTAWYVALNDAQVILVQNYLAAKYNVALTSNDTYRGDDTGFDYDVAGIGRVNGTNLHADARGTGWVRMYDADDLDNNEFLTWGHNYGNISSTNTSDVPAGVEARLHRVWRVSERNAQGSGTVQVGDVNIQIDLSQLQLPITASDLRLLIDSDGDGIFNEGSTIQISGAIELSCNVYLFTAVPDNSLTDGDQFTIGTADRSQTPLPVSLSSFKGAMEDTNVRLFWETVSEKDNDYFTIQRSINGKDFYAVGRVDGAGTSITPKEYTYTDIFPPAGRIYYRLLQTDFDGAFSYSNVITLTNQPESLALTVVPNPASPESQVLLHVSYNERVDPDLCTVRVYDMTGRSVPATMVVDGAGEMRLGFNESAPGGLYIVTVTSPQFAGTISARVQLIR